MATSSASLLPSVIVLFPKTSMSFRIRESDRSKQRIIIHFQQFESFTFPSNFISFFSIPQITPPQLSVSNSSNASSISNSYLSFPRLSRSSCKALLIQIRLPPSLFRSISSVQILAIGC
ncbi:unnamed protein product [Microthlaspi erraticum]|uniref:Uncharacterized protein n=1 Tax=Microthlaspi erraticum TaxID=1685480 RepID=A0A6D2KPE6_9BRAS|nr:unnamed protein product [Microthlaspi erraticum]